MMLMGVALGMSKEEAEIAKNGEDVFGLGQEASFALSLTRLQRHDFSKRASSFASFASKSLRRPSIVAVSSTPSQEDALERAALESAASLTPSQEVYGAQYGQLAHQVPPARAHVEGGG